MIEIDDAILDSYEFERKFFLDSDSYPKVDGPSLIIQSYPAVESEFSLRVRMTADLPQDFHFPNVEHSCLLERLLNSGLNFSMASVAVKGENVGGTAYERELAIDPEAAHQLIVVGPNVIKTRAMLMLGESDLWSIDRFYGENFPLVMAEIERDLPVDRLDIPAFCVSEVTEDRRFQNANLARTPFLSWQDQYLKELDTDGPTFLQL